MSVTIAVLVALLIGLALLALPLFGPAVSPVQRASPPPSQLWLAPLMSSPSPVAEPQSISTVPLPSSQSGDHAYTSPGEGVQRRGRPLAAPEQITIFEGDRTDERGIAAVGDRITPDGALTPRVLAAEIAQRRGAIAAVYEKLLRDEPLAAGRLTLRFVIDGEGAVRDVAVVHDSLGNARLAERVTKLVGEWRLPAPPDGRPVQVVYPVVLRPLAAR